VLECFYHSSTLDEEGGNFLQTSEINSFVAHPKNSKNLLLNPNPVEISDFTIYPLIRVNMPKKNAIPKLLKEFSYLVK
jgi:hypothetical protein